MSGKKMNYTGERLATAFSAVSLFSNCGAGDVGFKRAGFRFRALAEIEVRRLEIAMRNHCGALGIPGDLSVTWPLVVDLLGGSSERYIPDLLAACPPCQGMSSAQSKRGSEADPDAGSRDSRNLLVVPIAKVAKELQPRLVVIENVPAFFRRMVRHPGTGKPLPAALVLIELLADEYEVFPLLADLADFGVPQTRRRAFLTFVRKTEPVLRRLASAGLAPYPLPLFAEDHGGGGHVSLGRFLSGLELPELDASSYEAARCKVHRLHRVPVLDERIYEMVAAIPPNSGASAWDNDNCRACGKVKVSEEEWACPKCGGPLPRPLVKEAGSGEFRFVSGFRRSSYRRLDPGSPSATVTTASGRISSDRNIHPNENRVLSVLECARLQTFPEDFDWGGSPDFWGDGQVRAMIGEAVPPLFTELHGRVLGQMLSNDSLDGLLRISDARCKKAREALGMG